MKNASDWTKITLVFLAVIAIRAIPLRAPNVEPVMAAVMPLSKRYGALASVLFGALSIIVWDFFTSGIGGWTATTAVAYALVGLASAYYFRSREASRGRFVGFSIAAVLFYDAVTGVIAGPLFTGGSFSLALAGQIPFTLMHLAGAVMFAALVSPALMRFLASESVPAFASRRVGA